MASMHEAKRPYLTQHRCRRLVLWALTMLAWIGAVLAGVVPNRRRQRQRGDVSLDTLADFIKQLVLMRDAEVSDVEYERALFSRHDRDLRCAHVFRSVIGSKLRRALRHRDPARRIALLIHALKHLDVLTADFARRVRRGFTRLWPILPALMPAVAIRAAAVPALAAPDSS